MFQTYFCSSHLQFHAESVVILGQEVELMLKCKQIPLWLGESRRKTLWLCLNR